MRRHLRLTGLIFACLGLAACSAMLPHGETETTSPWKSYEDVKLAYDQVVVGQSDREDLRALRFTPDQTANVRILNHLEIVSRVMPNHSLSRDDLPPALLTCLGLQDGCQAYEIKLLVTTSQRYGSFLADTFNFRRKTHIQGWAFNAVFVLQGEKVIYKVWNGTPRIDEHREDSNPLGPLQDAGGDAVRTGVDY